MVVFVRKWLHSVQKWLCSRQSGCIPGKIVVCGGKVGFIRAIVVVFER